MRSYDCCISAVGSDLCRSRHRTQPGLPRSVRVLTAALAAAAVIALVVGVWAAVEGPPPVWWQFVACAALFVLAGLASFSMRFGSHKVLFWWSEVAVVVSLMLLPLGWVVLATTFGAAAKALRRRHQPLKAVFNAALDIAAVGFVVALLSLSGWAPLQVTEIGDLVAVIAAALIYSQLTEVCTALVIGLSQGRSPLAIYRAGADDQPGQPGRQHGRRGPGGRAGAGRPAGHAGAAAAAVLPAAGVRGPAAWAGRAGVLAGPARRHPVAGRPGRAGCPRPGHRRGDPAVRRRPGRGRAGRATGWCAATSTASATTVRSPRRPRTRRPPPSSGRSARTPPRSACSGSASRRRSRSTTGSRRCSARSPPSCTPRWSTPAGTRPRSTRPPTTRSPACSTGPGCRSRAGPRWPRPPPPGWTPRSCSSTSAGSGRSWTPSGTPPVTPCWCTPRAGWRTRCCPASWSPGWRATSSPCCCRSSPTRRRPRTGPTRCSARSPARPWSAAPRSA